MENNEQKRRGLLLSIECVHTLNEGLVIHHTRVGCPKPQWSRYLSFLKSKIFADLTKPKYLKNHEIDLKDTPRPKIHTLFSTECTPYFDWQTVGLMHSFYLSGQPDDITRLLSCTDEDLRYYKGLDLAPTHIVPSMSMHPLTGDW